MQTAVMGEAFFHQVRLVSVTLSSQGVVLMVHRAVWDGNRCNLSYRWEIVQSYLDYNREQVYLLVRRSLSARHITKTFFPLVKQS